MKPTRDTVAFLDVRGGRAWLMGKSLGDYRTPQRMDTSEYKYDVAFSFLAQDETLASELNDLLQDRVRTFMYSKKQGELAGTDGEKSFNGVFGQEARLVVVLYRGGWGQTPWTRIEETAIRNRAFEHGYKFVKFIPLEDPPTVPKWLPRTHLWVGLKRWGVAGAASVIEARVEELGGQPHEETVAERAARLERSLKFTEKRKHFLNSDAGVRAANEEFEALRTELERLLASAKESTSSISLHLKSVQRQVVILGLGPGLSVNWRYHYANSLNHAQLDVVLWDNHPPFPGIMHFEDPKKLRTVHFMFDLLPTEQRCWMSSGFESRAYATKDLASFILKYYMDQADALKARR